jgi:hypothetical protein
LVLQCFSSARSNPWWVSKDLSEYSWIKFADVFKKALHFIMNTNFLTGKEHFYYNVNCLFFTKLYLKCRLIIKFTSTGAINAIPRSSSQTGRPLRSIHFSNGNECIPFYISWSGSPLRYIHISNDNGSFTFYVDFFFPLSFPKLLPDLTVYMSYTVGVL